MEYGLLMRGIVMVVLASCVPLLVFIGYKLFLAGATGKMNIAIQNNSMKGKITNLSPGGFCFLLAVLLGYFLIQREFSSSSVTEYPPESGDKQNANQPINSGSQGASTRLETKTRWYIGDIGEITPEIKKTYIEAGSCLHTLKYQTRLSDQQAVSDCLSGVEVLLKKPLSPVQLKSLNKAEKDAQDGNPDILRALLRDHFKEKPQVQEQ